jgi:class 3 adenylate cyclase
VARLSAAERARLPDRSFAYVDSQGRRRLPITDASHVRNALARFGQVEFESDEARDQARLRLLRAAKRFRIVPVGFISAELRNQRTTTAGGPRELPTGFVTLLMTDIEDSTGHLGRLGDGFVELLSELREIQRAAVDGVGGCVVETRADELFAAFESPLAALDAAITSQRNIGALRRSDGVAARIRIGLHAGYPTKGEPNYIGMDVHLTARISSCAHGGQIVMSGDTRTALTGMVPAGVRFRSLGTHRLRGIPHEVPLYQVTAPGLGGRFPALRT